MPVNVNGTLDRARREADPLERSRMMLAALARRDDSEVARLWATTPRRRYVGPDVAFAEPAERLLFTLASTWAHLWALDAEARLAEATALTAGLATDAVWDAVFGTVRVLRDAGHIEVTDDELGELLDGDEPPAPEGVITRRDWFPSLARELRERADVASRAHAGAWAGIFDFADRLDIDRATLAALLTPESPPDPGIKPDPAWRASTLRGLVLAAGDLLPHASGEAP